MVVATFRLYQSPRKKELCLKIQKIILKFKSEIFEYVLY